LNVPADRPNHANYIGQWLGILREDKRAIFRAAAQAQKAEDWILNLHPDFAAHTAEVRPISSDSRSKSSVYEKYLG
jgi:antirestriction protein ArdC